MTKDKLNVSLKSLFAISSLFLLFAVISSCHKEAEVIENLISVTKIDRSIPTDFDIVEFSVVNENLCFAIGQKGVFFKIFKTSNGGISWSELNNPASNAQPDLNIQSIVFFDEDNGVIVLRNKGYRTFDGGQTWSNVLANDYTGNNAVLTFAFAGKNEANELILAETNPSSWYHNHIYTGPSNSPIYNIVTHYPHQSDQHDYGNYSNGRLHLYERGGGSSNNIYVYDFTSGVLETISYNGAGVMDLNYANGRIVLARQYGKINFYQGTSQEWNVDYYNYHEENYNSIERVNDYYIAVANKSITTNFSGRWEEAINADGSGHLENFLKIQKIDTENVYISGAEGLFIKATLK